ncbi:unnamed protein product [Vicia faba]|uniref:Reverse transcriptase domain-containing protein n=1 Tax=Vicia faba TaxID=3906 RepID=A0AAV0Z8T9_VICFA|nr:unnamed protein product [Vicia faba]
MHPLKAPEPDVMPSMGYPTSMVNLIRNYIAYVSYKVLDNGHSSPSFTPKRGLRQGDLLSPYLFILGVDVLSGLLNQEAHMKRIHIIYIVKKALVITHLFFADDNLLFTRANY